MKWFGFFIRILIGGLFIYSSIPKIIDPIGFAMSIENYRILPVFLIKPAAFFLSFSLLLAGIALIIGFWTRIAIILAQILLVIFISALFSTIIRGIDIECGCFKGAKFKAKATFIFDIILFCLSFVVLFAKNIPFSIDKLIEKLTRKERKDYH
ncbi:MAG: MauE/DoxX family redox-associated membrane protein [bacterium]